MQKTNNRLNDLMVVLRWPDKHKVNLATLQALRDRLTIAECAARRQADKERHKEEFFPRIDEQFQKRRQRRSRSGRARRVLRAFALLFLQGLPERANVAHGRRYEHETQH